jgi:hypothetical protein
MVDISRIGETGSEIRTSWPRSSSIWVKLDRESNAIACSLSNDFVNFILPETTNPNLPEMGK